MKEAEKTETAACMYWLDQKFTKIPARQDFPFVGRLHEQHPLKPIPTRGYRFLERLASIVIIPFDTLFF